MKGRTHLDNGEEMPWTSVVADDKSFKTTYDDMIKHLTGKTDEEVDEENVKLHYLKRTLKQAAKSKQNIDLNGLQALYGHGGSAPQTQANLNKLVYPTPKGNYRDRQKHSASPLVS